MMIVFPLAAMIAVSMLYRDELGARALIIYWAIWVFALLIVLGFQLSLGVFVAAECALAVALLIHVRANPQL